jgi:D-lactate dehydrogenase (cytochrome)
MLIKKDPDLISAYLEDYSNLKGGFCQSVIFPESEEEVIAAVKNASNKKTPVTVSAAGTGVTGGRIPFGGSVLSVEKLNNVLDIKRLPSGEGLAVVEPGLILKDFLERIEQEGFFYPPDPTEKGSFIGGNVSTSASGARSFKFGTTRDFVLGLRMVLSNGDILDLERGQIFADKRRLKLPMASGETLVVDIPGYMMPQVKNAAGYFAREGMDAVDLFIGHEGTLGIITKIKLRLLEKRPGIIDCYAFFNHQEEGLDFVYKAREVSRGRDFEKKGIDAMSLEFFDENALRLLRQKHQKIPNQARAAIYFEQEVDEKSEPGILDAWAGLITDCGGLLDNTWFAQSAKERQELADIRHDLPDMVNEFIKRKNLTKVGTDIAVRGEHIAEMIRCYNQVLGQSGLRYLIFGHIGDSHLHVNILPENQKQHARAKELYEQFIDKAMLLKGTVSAEHGIGKIKHTYLKKMYGSQGIEEMAQLKKGLDPACILGLDNIFPKELLK